MRVVIFFVHDFLDIRSYMSEYNTFYDNKFSKFYIYFLNRYSYGFFFLIETHLVKIIYQTFAKMSPNVDTKMYISAVYFKSGLNPFFNKFKISSLAFKFFSIIS